jgi:hypothetical protein
MRSWVVRLHPEGGVDAPAPIRYSGRPRIKVESWIADFYDTNRRYGADDSVAPIAFEHQTATARAASAGPVRIEVA